MASLNLRDSIKRFMSHIARHRIKVQNAIGGVKDRVKDALKGK
jgi:hypothetical protein